MISILEKCRHELDKANKKIAALENERDYMQGMFEKALKINQNLRESMREILND